MGLLLHYINIAFRNMWKAKSQTLISVTGLTLGITCFSLATIWIVYELTFDRFHKNAKQMYVVVNKSEDSKSGYGRHNVDAYASIL